MNNKIRLGIVLGTVLTILAGCSFLPSYVMPTALSFSTEDSQIYNLADSEVDRALQCSQMKAMGLPTELTLEAGSLLVPEIFQSSMREGEILLSTSLTADQLATYGASYEVCYTFDGVECMTRVTIGDTVAPTMNGVVELYVTTGSSVSYKKDIITEDNSNGEVTISVDNSQVDLYTVGDYPITYTATDQAGNSSSMETIIHVSEPSEITEDDVLPLADAVIEKVITDDMSQYDQAYALFNWCRRNMSYSSSFSGDRTSVWSGAYEGLHNHYGDCYTYYATYSVLLTRVGIDNLCVARVGGTTHHWWNLVNTGDGWYHCDCSPRNSEHPYTCFMQTDAQVEAYTEWFSEHPNYYTFDPTLYPERATEIIYGSMDIVRTVTHSDTTDSAGDTTTDPGTTQPADGGVTTPTDTGSTTDPGAGTGTTSTDGGTTDTGSEGENSTGADTTSTDTEGDTGLGEATTDIAQ